jgi:hypothetical protein
VRDSNSFREISFLLQDRTQDIKSDEEVVNCGTKSKFVLRCYDIEFSYFSVLVGRRTVELVLCSIVDTVGFVASYETA